MLSTDLQKLINVFLAGEMLSWKQMVPHLNWALDEINSELNTEFPLFENDTVTYEAFPDKYVRTVIVPGAVYHFYQVDEEGLTQSTQFKEDFYRGLYAMQRDYSHLIPEEYQSDVLNGTVDSVYQDEDGLRGVTGLTFDSWG